MVFPMIPIKSPWVFHPARFHRHRGAASTAAASRPGPRRCAGWSRRRRTRWSPARPPVASTCTPWAVENAGKCWKNQHQLVGFAATKSRSVGANNSNVTMVYGTQITIVNRVYKPTYNRGAPHCKKNHGSMSWNTAKIEFWLMKVCNWEKTLKNPWIGWFWDLSVNYLKIWWYPMEWCIFFDVVNPTLGELSSKPILRVWPIKDPPNSKMGLLYELFDSRIIPHPLPEIRKKPLTNIKPSIIISHHLWRLSSLLKLHSPMFVGISHF